jgi:hypothetical protein
MLAKEMGLGFLTLRDAKTLEHAQGRQHHTIFGTSWSSVQQMNRRFAVTHITLTPEEAAALRGALSCYVFDLRMEIADTDSWQFRQNLKHEEVLLKQLLQQLDPEWASPGAFSSPGDSTLARSGGDAPRPEILT